MKKIFFSDLDGTLLNSAKKIDDRTRSALENFIAAGNFFAVSTGRAMESAISVQRELGLNYPRTFLSAYNGAQIYDCDNRNTIYRIGIDYELLPPIFELAAKHGVHVHTYNDTQIISPHIRDEGDQDCMDFYRRAIHSPVILTNDVTRHLDSKPGKCIAVELEDSEKLELFRVKLLDLVGEKLTLMYSTPFYLEIIPKGVGKGAALEKLCDYLGISTDSAIAAGDEENDIDMIRTAGLGIAMKNGTNRAKAAANVVTEEDNDHDGLAPFLEGGFE